MVTFPKLTEEQRIIISASMTRMCTIEDTEEANKLVKMIADLFGKEDATLVAGCLALDTALFNVQQTIHEQSILCKIEDKAAGHG